MKRILPEPSIGLVTPPVMIGSASLLGARSCKDWERNTIGSSDQLEREFVFLTRMRRNGFIGKK